MATVVAEAAHHRHNSPANQDPGDPDSRSDLVQQEIAGNLKQEIAEKENSHQQSELLARDGQFLVHRQRGKPNVDPVEIGNDVQQKKIRDNPEPQFLNRSCLYGHRTGVRFFVLDRLSVNAPGQEISSARAAGRKRVRVAQTVCIRRATVKRLRDSYGDNCCSGFPISSSISPCRFARADALRDLWQTESSHGMVLALRVSRTSRARPRSARRKQARRKNQTVDSNSGGYQRKPVTEKKNPMFIPTFSI